MTTNHHISALCSWLCLLLCMMSLSVQAQTGNRAQNNTFTAFGNVSLATAGSQAWSTRRTSTPTFFAMVGDASYTNAADANANVDGYIRHYATGADQTAVFPVGTGADLRQVTISGTRSASSEIAVAWIAGDPTTTPDPTMPGGLHDVTAVSSGSGIVDVMTLGQWDWMNFGTDDVGMTVTVSIPDLSSYAPAGLQRLVGWDGSQWVNLSGNTSATGNTEDNTLSGSIISGITAISVGRAVDSDMDGVADLEDLDDDNDGILDSDEQECGLVENGALSDGTTGWGFAGNVLVDTQRLLFNSADLTPNGVASQTISTTAGEDYILSFDVMATTAGPMALEIEFGGVGYGSYQAGPGGVSLRHQIALSASSSSSLLRLIDASTATTGIDLSVDNIVICRAIDTDGDGVVDIRDRDSDNDGIYDLIEAGHGATDSNADGVIDGAPATFGVNGLFDGVEDTPDSGVLDQATADSDGDGNIDAIELDSDNDGCNDVIEAGFADPDGNGLLGSGN